MADSTISPLEMDDEAFLKLNSPEELPAQDSSDNKTVDEPAVEEPAVVVAEPVVVENKPEEIPDATKSGDEPGITPEEKPVPVAGSEDTSGKEAEKPTTEKPVEAEKPAVETKVEEKAPDYEAFYKQIMKPFKANGKTIELRDPEEAVQLMQMGANYTKKLQQLQPHRKMLLMLENNGLLDEGKLSYLIDLDKKNPEAIKKLIKDSGIDPLDIDPGTEPAYTQSNHSVSDAEVNFKTKLEEITSTPAGVEMITEINRDWDDASKDLLWESPEVLSVIQQQRENGIYSKITAEMDRQKTLGKIPANTPFLVAYKQVGDHLYQAGSGGNNDGAPVVVPPKSDAPVVVTTRAAAPKPQVSNDDKAGAASPTRASPGKADVKINPLAMSDDDFLKNMAGRL